MIYAFHINHSTLIKNSKALFIQHGLTAPAIAAAISSHFDSHIVLVRFLFAGHTQPFVHHGKVLPTVRNFVPHGEVSVPLRNE